MICFESDSHSHGMTNLSAENDNIAKDFQKYQTFSRLVEKSSRTMYLKFLDEICRIWTFPQISSKSLLYFLDTETCSSSILASYDSVHCWD